MYACGSNPYPGLPLRTLLMFILLSYDEREVNTCFLEKGANPDYWLYENPV